MTEITYQRTKSEVFRFLLRQNLVQPKFWLPPLMLLAFSVFLLVPVHPGLFQVVGTIGVTLAVLIPLVTIRVWSLLATKAAALGTVTLTFDILAHVGGSVAAHSLNIDWYDFLNSIKSWVEPTTLPYLLPMICSASSESGEGRQLTPDALCKEIFLRMEAAPSPGLTRSIARTFVKLIFLGNVFQFLPEFRHPTWRTPFSNKLAPKDLITAYARVVVRRLRTKFPLTAAELPSLLKFLFPVEIGDAEEALRQALAETE